MFGQSLLSGAFGGAACTTDTDQLFATDVTATTVSTYQFNNNTNDLSGNYNATPSATLSYVTGIYDQAVVMDNRWITVASTATTPLDYSSENFAISLWARFDNVNLQVILSKWGTGSSGNRSIFFYMDSGKWTVYEYTTSGASNSIVSNTTFVTGQWYNIVYSRNPTTAFMYVDGQLDNQQIKTTNIKNGGSQNFYFGRVQGSGGGTMTGDIDQARFFNTALPQSAVTALYNETTTTAQSASIDYVGANPNSIAYYKMSNATDQLGNYNGTATSVNFNTEGKFGFAGAFNGSSSEISLGSSNSFSYTTTGALSINMWIKTTNTSTAYVISKANDSSGQYEWSIEQLANGTLSLHAYTNAGGFASTINNTAVINDGNWHNVVGVIVNNTSTTLYIDGIAATSTSFSGTGASYSIPTLIGHFGGIPAATAWFEGDIDQVRMYNSALSAADVTKLYKEIECPAATIVNSFNTVLYTGNGTGQKIPLNFAPDFVWIKSRETASWNTSHYTFNSVSGAFRRLKTNTSDAENTFANSLSSFDSDGFTVQTALNINDNNQEFVAWNWKAGGAAVSNTDGTIASSVSANKEAGFSVVKYTGNEIASQTVGHGLSSKVEIAFIKQLDGGREWQVPLFNSTSGDYLILNDTDQKANDTARWSAVSSTTFTIGNQPYTNGSGSPYIAYCFTSIPGYSRVGSYIGTNATNNVQYLGFSPRFLMVKRTNAASAWLMMDAVINPSSPFNTFLIANTDGAEFVANALAFSYNSTSFTVANTDGTFNASGGEYIFLAIA